MAARHRDVRDLGGLLHCALTGCWAGVTSSQVRPAPTDGGQVLDLREIERRTVDSALQACGGSVTRAAKLLGIGRATLYRWLSEQRAG